MTLHLVKLLVITATAVAIPVATTHHDDDACEDVAQALKKAAEESARSDYWVAIANCRNDTGGDDSCEKNAKADLKDALDLATEQYKARKSACEMLGGGGYNPQVSPADFSADITNNFSPYTPGVTLVYEGDSVDGFVHNEVKTLSTTATIDGFTVRAVEDTVTLDGVLSEDATDYFAQRTNGEVWYLGEISRQYEDGFLNDLEGSWRTGKDDAKPGIIMESSPHVNDVYRQEYQATVAEDVAQVLSVDETVTIGLGTYAHCLKTLEFSPLEPGSTEWKFYAPGIGMILDVDLQTGDRLELVAIQ